MFTSLKLTNFKGFQEATVPLGPLTLLVGTNASGKSNVREALQFLYGCSQNYSLAEIIGEKWGQGGALLWRGLRGGVREIAFHGSDRFEIGVDSEFFTYSIDVDLGDDRAGPRVAHESLYSEFMPAGSCTDRGMVFDSHPTDDPLQQEDAHRLRIRFPRGGRHRKHGPARNYLSSHPVLTQIRNDEEVYKEHRRDVLLASRAFEGMRFLDLTPHAMREASLPGHRILGDNGENLSSVLLGIVEEQKHKDALLAWLGALTPMDVRDLSFKKDFQGRVLVHLIEADGREISAQSASDGTLRFLALIAALLGPESGRFFFFEEIDNGIHPTRLHVLLDALERLGSHMGCQIVATTHNPQLLAFLSEEARQDAVLLYRREESESAEAVRIMELPNIEQIIKEQDLGRLFASGWLEDMADFLADQETVAPETARV